MITHDAVHGHCKHTHTLTAVVYASCSSLVVSQDVHLRLMIGVHTFVLDGNDVHFESYDAGGKSPASKNDAPFNSVLMFF